MTKFPSKATKPKRAFRPKWKSAKKYDPDHPTQTQLKKLRATGLIPV